MAHPFVGMFHEEITMIVDNYEDARATAPPHLRGSLVVILRGLPGSGKSTFALMLKMYAESKGIQAAICSADHAFRSPSGYNFNAQGLRQAHRQSQERCRLALAHRIPIVIIDNTNVRQDEWTPYVAIADQAGFQHRVCRVNFRVSEDLAQMLRARSFHQVPFHTIARRIDELAANDRAYQPCIQVDPILHFDTHGQAELPGRVHVMERIFFEEIRDVVVPFSGFHFGSNSDRSSLVFILRGMPGCGKSTFAAQVQVFAGAHGLETDICSDAEYFRTATGQEPNPLLAARRRCLQFFQGALDNFLPVIVLDNDNLTRADWEPFVDRARRAKSHVHLVNFTCDTLDEADGQAERSFARRDLHEVAQRFQDYEASQARFQAIQGATVHNVAPIFNTWDNDIGDMANRAMQ